MSTRTLPRSHQPTPPRTPLRMLGGVTLCLLAFYVFLCLISYNQADPSFNRATGNPASNAGGYTGALIADLSLQLLGLASALWVLVPGAWGVKMLRGLPVSHLWLRSSLLMGALVLCAAWVASFEPPLSWPIASGFGGMIGSTVHDALHVPFKSLWFMLGFAVVTLVVTSLAFGMSWSEWRGLAAYGKQLALVASGLVLALIDRVRGR